MVLIIESVQCPVLIAHFLWRCISDFLKNFTLYLNMIYNILVSGVQQSDSDIYIYRERESARVCVHTHAICLLSCFSHVRLFETPWTVARQAYLSMGFSRQEYWNGLPCSSPGDLPNPGIKPMSLMTPMPHGKPYMVISRSIHVAANGITSFIFMAE